VLQFFAVHCSPLHCIAVHCSALQYVAVCCRCLHLHDDNFKKCVDRISCVRWVCYNVLQRVTGCCRCRCPCTTTIQCVTVSCSVLQRVAVCCSVLHCDAVCCRRHCPCTTKTSYGFTNTFRALRIVLQSVIECCRGLQLFLPLHDKNTVCFSMLQCVTGYRRPIWWLIWIGHFPQKSSIVNGSFAERHMHFKTSYEPTLPYTVAQYVAVWCRCQYMRTMILSTGVQGGVET